MSSAALSALAPGSAGSIAAEAHRGRPWLWRSGSVIWSPRKSKVCLVKESARTRTGAGIHIDRRHHLDQSWRRQQEEEARQAEAEVTCPVDCVREVFNFAEFEKVLKEAEAANDLVVVDFYNSSCGACKYVLPQFVKMCKRGFSEEDRDVEPQRGVLFVKHNVRDEYDDLTDMARFYSIRHVPMFSFFMDGSRVEQFPARDRARLEQSIARLLARYE